MKSPVEQFEIVPILNLEIYEQIVDLTITNLALTSFIILGLLKYLVSLIVITKKQSSKNTIKFIPSRWQLLVKYLLKAVAQIVTDNLRSDSDAQTFLPFILTLFSIILFINLVGLIPYSFTVSSHLIITFLLSFSVFIGTSIICFQKHNYRVIELIVPANTSIFLTILLINFFVDIDFFFVNQIAMIWDDNEKKDKDDDDSSFKKRFIAFIKKLVLILVFSLYFIFSVVFALTTRDFFTALSYWLVCHFFIVSIIWAYDLETYKKKIKTVTHIYLLFGIILFLIVYPMYWY